MMARILSSLSAASKASIISFCIAALKAFSLSGRFSVMVRICSAISYLIVSYAMGVSSRLFLDSNLVIAGLDPAIHRYEGRWMRGSSPRMTVSSLLTVLTFRRALPRPWRTAQALERLGNAEHAEIVEAAADDLHADRKSARAKAAVDRNGGIFRHVPRHSVADMLERFCGIVDRGGEFGGEIHYRRHWRNHVIEIGEQFCRCRPDRHGGVKTPDHVDAREFRTGFRPFVDIGQRLGAFGRRDPGKIVPRAGAPEGVEPVKHLARQYARYFRDDGAGCFERP